jgi:hypothetical protein
MRQLDRKQAQIVRRPRLATAQPEISGSQQALSLTPQCERCLFRLTGKPACVAFPWGIPLEIRNGDFDHTEPHPGDGGFRFVPFRHTGLLAPSRLHP